MAFPGRPDVRGATQVIRAELRQGRRLSKWCGLVFVALGCIFEVVGGVFLAVTIYGRHKGTTAAIWMGIGIALLAGGNLIWQRARLLDRRERSG